MLNVPKSVVIISFAIKPEKIKPERDKPDIKKMMKLTKYEVKQKQMPKKKLDILIIWLENIKN